MREIKCPRCGKLTTWENNEFRPFCSERCKMIDFGAWADEDYRVPDENSPLANQISQQDLQELLDEENAEDFKNVNL